MAGSHLPPGQQSAVREEALLQGLSMAKPGDKGTTFRLQGMQGQRSQSSNSSILQLGMPISQQRAAAAGIFLLSASSCH